MIYPHTLRKAIAYLGPNLIKICSKYDRESFLLQVIFVINAGKMNDILNCNLSNQLLKTQHF